jgi:HK97 gp10 family phage protein
MIGIEVTGLKKLTDKLKKAEKSDMFEQTNKEAANLAYERAIHNDYGAPVDTGELRRSVYVNIIKDGFELGATARHAIFNEYGSIYTPLGPGKMSGFRPFIRPAVYHAIQRYPGIFSKNWKRVMHG